MRRAAHSAFVATLVVGWVACSKEPDTADPGTGPAGPPAWVSRPPPLPSEQPYVSSVLTPGCTDGAWLFDVRLSGWGGELEVTASLDGATEVVALVSQELEADGERWSGGPGAGEPFALPCEGADQARVLYEVYSLDFVRTDCVTFGSPEEPGCADASAW